MGLGYYFLGGNVILSLKQLERTPLGSEKKKYKQKQKKKRLHCVIWSRFRTLASLHRWSFQVDWKRVLQYVLYRFALVFSSLLTLKYKFWKQTIYALGKRERKGKRRREETGRICELTAASMERWTLRKADGRPITWYSISCTANEP